MHVWGPETLTLPGHRIAPLCVALIWQFNFYDPFGTQDFKNVGIARKNAALELYETCKLYKRKYKNPAILKKMQPF